MNAVFHPAAQREAQKATAHYTEINEQLGRDFRIELEREGEREWVRAAGAAVEGAFGALNC